MSRKRNGKRPGASRPPGWAALNGLAADDLIIGAVHPLYGEAQVIGDDVIIGQVTVESAGNTVVDSTTIPERPILFATVEAHQAEVDPAGSQQDASPGVYHGGYTDDELAAVISLWCGIPCRSGGASRLRLSTSPDSRWRATEMMYDVQRYSRPRPNGRSPIVGRTSSLNVAEIGEALRAYARCEPKDVAALLRATRSYSLGRWVINDDPNETWLRYVSAIETAAQHWKRGGQRSLDALRTEERALAEALRSIDPMAEDLVAKSSLVQGLKAGKTFVEFLTEFSPPPPDSRPAPAFQLDFGDVHQMSTIFRIVYGARSAALHGSEPFPLPMLVGSVVPKEDGTLTYSETGIGGLSAQGAGGSWLPEDAPVSLNTWDYITRETLLNWARSITQGDT